MCSYHGQSNGLLIQSFRLGRPSHTTAVLQTGVLGNRHFPFPRTERKQFPNARRKLRYVLAIQVLATLFLTLFPPGPRVGISETFLFGLLQGVFFHQQPLPLVSLAGVTPFEHDSR